MASDLSWTGPAQRYADVYRWALDKKLAGQRQQQALAADIERTARVIAQLPARIGRLGELAYNLWWTWQPEAQTLFAQLSTALWDESTHNPIRVLRAVTGEQMAAAATDPVYLAAYDRVMKQFDAYMGEHATWFSGRYPYATEDPIAYLSFEFGLHESLPIYSGGLGVLAGDSCKEASDLGLPFVAVGFLYPQGFFLQQIDADGRQIAVRQKVNFAELPALAVRDADGKHVTIAVDLPGRSIYAQLWRMQVGRIALIMMDTDIEQNSLADRQLVAQLYHGDQETRIAQEMIFGLGAARALRAIGINPSAWHLNEGHGAFLTLELLRELVQSGVEPQAAIERVRAQTLFTTHTPVPAGNDAFAPELMDKYFGHIIPQLGLARDAFLHLGMHDGQFSMTVLALRLTSAANGVSRLHGEVSRQMWGWVWPNVPADRVPIRSITNGVHSDTWLAPEIGTLFARYLGARWHEQLDEPALWEAVARIPDDELWLAHTVRRTRLVELIRAAARQRAVRLGQPDTGFDRLLDTNMLTIGFARRFATYKRATLIFRDAERLKRILNDPARPVQIIFAGKSHPADMPGQEFIRQVFGYSQAEGLRGRIHFLEEYNMFTARFLVAGVDVWLNNPRRPLEASGTSGMKASLNGIPTASILDGWWVEGYNGSNGWAIESADARATAQDAQDAQDAESLYRVLEQQIVPLYYRRDADGLPHDWLKVMKEAIRTVAPQFSTRRMLKQYVEMWIAAMARGGSV
ncbi:MAG: alpha-glucan family phosphorylase [Chloroflexi bacterium]|nr:alpha-glucan family phosphorylase [Chloroflexota bacterium]